MFLAKPGVNGTGGAASISFNISISNTKAVTVQLPVASEEESYLTKDINCRIASTQRYIRIRLPYSTCTYN